MCKIRRVGRVGEVNVRLERGEEWMGSERILIVCVDNVLKILFFEGMEKLEIR